MSAVTSIRARQQASISDMLTLSDSDTPWKVLVYDVPGKEILAPLVKVQELRKLGVTLHLLLHGDRKPIPEVPAVYFISPTKENIERLAQDIVQGVYDVFHVHFSSPVPRESLESLASTVLRGNATHRVAKVYDQYLNFCALESRLFSLMLDNSYLAVNGSGNSDAAIDAMVNAMVHGLFSAVITLGAIPIIRAQRGEAAEMVATRLEKRIRDYLKTRDDIDKSVTGAPRPLLVILDRNLDLSIGLHHSWIYENLIHDVLGIRSNRVTMDVAIDDPTGGGGGGGGVKTKIYDLEENDEFWSGNKSKPFPDVTVEADAALKKFKESSEEIYRQSGAVIGADGKIESTESVGASNLASVVSRLPELTERKRLLDLHMNVATALMQAIKERELDEYFSVEESIMGHSRVDRNALKARLGPTGKGTQLDKLRLLLIYYLSTEGATPSDIAELEAAVKECGVDTTALAFLKKIRGMSGGGGSFSHLGSSGSGGGGGGQAQSLITDLFQTAVGKSKEALKDATAAARKWVSMNNKLPVVRVCDALLNEPSSPDVAGYLCLDPRAVNPTAVDPTAGKLNFSTLITFMVGGGTYIEHLELLNHFSVQNKKPISVFYGGTELLSPESLVEQIAMSGGAQPRAGKDHHPSGIM